MIKHGGIRSTLGRACRFLTQDNFLNLEWEKDQDKHREGSVQTTHISKSHSRVRSHVSQRQDNNKAL